MIIRNGNYTRYQDFDFSLYTMRHEDPIPFTHFVLKWELADNCPIDGFNINDHGDCIKIVKRDEIQNAFRVTTNASYFGWSFSVEANVKLDFVSLKSSSPEPFEQLGFTCYNVGDEKLLLEENLYASKYFAVSGGYSLRKPLIELEKIWEERSETEFELPLPPNLESVQFIEM